MKMNGIGTITAIVVATWNLPWDMITSRGSGIYLGFQVFDGTIPGVNREKTWGSECILRS